MIPHGQAQSKENEESLLQWMRRTFPGAFATSAHGLAERARRSVGEDRDRLFERAYNRFRGLHCDNPMYVPALKLWGAALARRVPTMPTADAERTNAEAEEKLSLALTLAPDDVEILATLASVLVRRAWLTPPDVARPPLARARELAEKALSLEPYRSDALNTWAHVLYEQVHAAPAGDIDRTLAEAFEKFKSAYDTTAKSSILGGWGTIAFAQADRASGSDVGRLLQVAKEKYAEAYSRDPISTYNLGCVCARLGEWDKCREWLEKSGEPGRYVTREEMAGDPELAAVRSEAWFQLLLAE
jgi:tetratricopeptide (TPR) repeat protein